MRTEFVLFDLDGTLADSEPLKAKALSQAVREFGGSAPVETYKMVMGKSWQSVTDAFFLRAGIQVPLERFNPVFRAHYSNLIETELQDVRGARKFISEIQQNNMKVGVVSSAAPWMIQKVLQKINLQDSFDVIVSGEDVLNHKPHPEAYLIAMDRLGSEPSKVIAFEDSESGVQAAIVAGIRVFGLRHDFNASHNFSLCKGVLESFESWIKLMN